MLKRQESPVRVHGNTLNSSFSIPFDEFHQRTPSDELFSDITPPLLFSCSRSSSTEGRRGASEKKTHVSETSYSSSLSSSSSSRRPTRSRALPKHKSSVGSFFEGSHTTVSQYDLDAIEKSTEQLTSVSLALLEEEVETKEGLQVKMRNDFERSTTATSGAIPVEEQTSLFEEVLCPEMADAINSLEQLAFEEEQVLSMLRIDEGASQPALDLVQAVWMEMQLRLEEKQKVLETFERVQQEREENVNNLLKEMKKVSNENAELRLAHQTMLDREQADEDIGLDVYDWVVDIDLLANLTGEGWQVTYSKEFQHTNSDGLNIASSEAHTNFTWDGAVIAVVGLFDKGKTFLLNQITGAHLPSSKKVSTKGLSFKHVDVESTHFVILDSAGSYAPVQVVSELSVVQKEATELFLMDLIFDLSDYFICVVNDFTSLDQRYLDKLTRSLQNSQKTFQEVIVVHNLKEILSPSVLEHAWNTQVTGIYSGGRLIKTKVAAVNPNTGELEEKYVTWFKTAFARHICLANNESAIGKKVNPWTIALLKTWLKSVLVPVNRKFSVVQSVMETSMKKLSGYFKDAIKLALYPGNVPNERFIRPTKDTSLDSLQLPQMSLDPSGLMLTRPDSFVPVYDVVTENDEYAIFMDVPGMEAKDITLSRRNVTTMIKGQRTLPYDSNAVSSGGMKRKVGQFQQNFEIPSQYERSWYKCVVSDGVLEMRFRADRDDYISVTENKRDSEIELNS